MQGRKFGFVTMPPLGSVPSIRVQQPGYDCMDELTALTALHNQALLKNLKNLEMQLEGFLYSKFDLFTSLINMLENPAKYGTERLIFIAVYPSISPSYISFA